MNQPPMGNMWPGWYPPPLPPQPSLWEHMRRAWRLKYGLIFGIPSGILGALQVALSVRDFVARQAVFDAAYPPNYTGYRDGTNLVRGAEWYTLGLFIVLLGIVSLFWFVPALIAARLARSEQASVGAVMSAAVICSIMYCAASIFGSLTDPLSASVGCLVQYPVLFVAEAWMIGHLGAWLGVRMGHGRANSPIPPSGETLRAGQ